MTDETKALDALLDSYGSLNDSGFKISLAEAADEWDAALRAAGVENACVYLAQRLCDRYAAAHGEAYLFSNHCVANEIKYHVDAYMGATGHSGYLWHITTLPFTRRALRAHCGVIDIGTEDVVDWRQRLLFRYRAGIRPEYKGTDRDPFRRSRSFCVLGLRKLKNRRRSSGKTEH